MSDVNYTRVNWKDSPDTSTPISAENLNKMDKGVSDCAVAINNNNTQIATMNNNLTGKVSGFASGNYAAVTGLAYDSTNSQLGLKVGADTIIPFKKGGLTEIKSYTAITYTYNAGSAPASETIDIKNYVTNWSSLTNDSFIVVSGDSGYTTGPYSGKSGSIGCLAMFAGPSISYDSSTGILTFRRPYVSSSCFIYGGAWFGTCYTVPACTLSVIS